MAAGSPQTPHLAVSESKGFFFRISEDDEDEVDAGVEALTLVAASGDTVEDVVVVTSSAGVEGVFLDGAEGVSESWAPLTPTLELYTLGLYLWTRSMMTPFLVSYVLN